MEDNKLALLGPALSKVGREVMRIVGGAPDGIYPYAEIGENWVGPSIFKDEGGKLLYFDYDGMDLDYALMAAWCLESADKRWTGMEYTIDGGKFDAKFQFDDVERGYEGSDDRRQQFLRARYGDKPVIYPPMPAGAMELRPAK